MKKTANVVITQSTNAERTFEKRWRGREKRMEREREKRMERDREKRMEREREKRMEREREKWMERERKKIHDERDGKEGEEGLTLHFEFSSLVLWIRENLTLLIIMIHGILLQGIF